MESIKGQSFTIPFELFLLFFSSLQMGFCGIPPALIQRYSDEIEVPVAEVAMCLEAIRVKYLVEACRCWVGLLMVYWNLKKKFVEAVDIR